MVLLLSLAFVSHKHLYFHQNQYCHLHCIIEYEIKVLLYQMIVFALHQSSQKLALLTYMYSYNHPLLLEILHKMKDEYLHWKTCA